MPTVREGIVRLNSRAASTVVYAGTRALRRRQRNGLLETSQASVDQIAAEVGYAEGVTLRALLRRRLGHGVREIRRSL